MYESFEYLNFFSPDAFAEVCARAREELTPKRFVLPPKSESSNCKLTSEAEQVLIFASVDRPGTTIMVRRELNYDGFGQEMLSQLKVWLFSNSIE